MTQSNKKWSDAAVATLLALVGNESPVSAATVEAAATQLEVSARSVASKLRSLEHDVATLAKEKVATFTPEQGAALSAFVAENAGTLTYKQIAEQFEAGEFTAKQVQGKLLALELTGSVKAADKIEAAKTYSAAEEAQFIALVEGGAFIEEIATALNKSIASVRGKALSLTRNSQIAKIPSQKESHAANTVDAVTALGDAIATMTVAAIATAVDKTERGVKTLLTRRAIKVADYDGFQKAAKAAAKTTAA